MKKQYIIPKIDPLQKRWKKIPKKYVQNTFHLRDARGAGGIRIIRFLSFVRRTDEHLSIKIVGFVRFKDRLWTCSDALQLILSHSITNIAGPNRRLLLSFSRKRHLRVEFFFCVRWRNTGELVTLDFWLWKNGWIIAGSVRENRLRGCTSNLGIMETWKAVVGRFMYDKSFHWNQSVRVTPCCVFFCLFCKTSHSSSQGPRNKGHTNSQGGCGFCHGPVCRPTTSSRGSSS